jgi:hypothetical protein
MLVGFISCQPVVTAHLDDHYLAEHRYECMWPRCPFGERLQWLCRRVIPSRSLPFDGLVGEAPSLLRGRCGLAVRDAAMIMAGVPARLRRGPAVLLWMELTAAVAASGLGLQSVMDDEFCKRAHAESGAAEMALRVAVGALFGLHTVSCIYLRPDQGRKRSLH